MAYNAIDIVNLRDCVKSLSDLQDKVTSILGEYIIACSRFEYFLNHYEDVPVEDDLPL